MEHGICPGACVRRLTKQNEVWLRIGSAGRRVLDPTGVHKYLDWSVFSWVSANDQRAFAFPSRTKWLGR